MKDEGQILWSGTMKFEAPYEDYAMERIVNVACPVHGGGIVLEDREPCCEKMTIEGRGARAVVRNPRP